MPKPLIYILIIMAVIIIGFLVLRFVVVPLFSTQPNNLGVTNGQLAPCPDLPNCVSSQAIDDEHAIESIQFSGSVGEAQTKLIAVLQSLDRSEIVTETPSYIHVVTKSPTMAFIDDNEFYFDGATSQIEIRAAARLGRADLGANRKRISAIRAAFEAQN